MGPLQLCRARLSIGGLLLLLLLLQVQAGGLTNVLNRGGRVREDPWVGCEGTHAQNTRGMLWGEVGYPAHAAWKNKHQGVAVFVRTAPANECRALVTPNRYHYQYGRVTGTCTVVRVRVSTSCVVVDTALISLFYRLRTMLLWPSRRSLALSRARRWSRLFLVAGPTSTRL